MKRKIYECESGIKVQKVGYPKEIFYDDKEQLCYINIFGGKFYCSEMWPIIEKYKEKGSMYNIISCSITVSNCIYFLGEFTHKSNGESAIQLFKIV